MADYGEVTYRGTASGNGTIYFVLASTTGGTTTYTLLGSTDIVNATISPYTTQNTFAFTAWVPTPSAGTTYQFDAVTNAGGLTISSGTVTNSAGTSYALAFTGT